MTDDCVSDEMTQAALVFDLDEAERLKADGMAVAADSQRSMLEEARSVAVRIARERGVVTADDVFRAIPGLVLGPAAGSLFRGGPWICTGQWKKSERVSNHARAIRVWMLK